MQSFFLLVLFPGEFLVINVITACLLLFDRNQFILKHGWLMLWWFISKAGSVVRGYRVQQRKTYVCFWEKVSPGSPSVSQCRRKEGQPAEAMNLNKLTASGGVTVSPNACGSLCGSCCLHGKPSVAPSVGTFACLLVSHGSESISGDSQHLLSFTWIVLKPTISFLPSPPKWK